MGHIRSKAVLTTIRNIANTAVIKLKMISSALRHGFELASTFIRVITMSATYEMIDKKRHRDKVKRQRFMSLQSFRFTFTFILFLHVAANNPRLFLRAHRKSEICSRCKNFQQHRFFVREWRFTKIPKITVEILLPYHWYDLDFTKDSPAYCYCYDINRIAKYLSLHLKKAFFHPLCPPVKQNNFHYKYATQTERETLYFFSRGSLPLI